MIRFAQLLTALASGAIFGAGLSLSGLLDPVRVSGFLDVAGDWDPRLAFMHCGAVAVAMAVMFVRRRLRNPTFGDAFHLPATAPIDIRLTPGSAIFGIGWGLAVLCPGPALALLSLGLAPACSFRQHNGRGHDRP